MAMLTVLAPTRLKNQVTPPRQLLPVRLLLFHSVLGVALQSMDPVLTMLVETLSRTPSRLQWPNQPASPSNVLRRKSPHRPVITLLTMRILVRMCRTPARLYVASCMHWALRMSCFWHGLLTKCPQFFFCSGRAAKLARLHGGRAAFKPIRRC